MKLVWGKTAKNDLKNIYDYIFNDSPVNAEKVLNTIIKKVEATSKMPLRHPIEPNLNKKHTRFIILWNFKIIYRVYNDKIFVKRIFHTKQNPKKI